MKDIIKVLTGISLVFVVAFTAGAFFGSHSAYTTICDNYAEVVEKQSKVVNETCYVKHFDIWVSRLAYDGHVKTLIRQNRVVK